MNLELKQLGTVKDRFDRETTVSALVSDGHVVAFIHSSDQSVRFSDDRRAEEHVIQSINVRKPGAKMWETDDVQSISAPSRSSKTLDYEPTLEQAWDEIKASYDWEQGYNFLTYGEQGATVPEDATEAFRTGMNDAQKKYRRTVRKGKLCGTPRSW